MSREERNGSRKTREQLGKHHVPNLGYYFIVTDTKETEQNYMYGLRDSIPPELQGKLAIKVLKTKTEDLVEDAKNVASLYPQYSETWIVFDRDQVKDFDNIIQQAEDAGINVGWTNPCIEAWFHSYFGEMPTCRDSVDCCGKFGKKYKSVCNQKYIKSEPKIYNKLNAFGDETTAIKLAQDKYDSHKRDGKLNPSEMSPCTTVHLLVKEIKDKLT